MYWDGGISNATVKKTSNQRQAPTFHLLKLSLRHFLAISQNFRSWCGLYGMDEISSRRYLFCLSLFQQFSGSNIWSSCLIWMKNPSLESYDIVIFKHYALGQLYVFLLMSAVFYRFQEKYLIWHHSTPFNPIWRFWYTYWSSMGYQYVDLSESLKLRGQQCSGNQWFKNYRKNAFQ